MPIIIIAKIDVKARSITKDNKDHFIMIKGQIHQENIPILYVYVPNDRASKCMEHKLVKLKGELGKSTVTLEDF